MTKKSETLENISSRAYAERRSTRQWTRGRGARTSERTRTDTILGSQRSPYQPSTRSSARGRQVKFSYLEILSASRHPQQQINFQGTSNLNRTLTPRLYTVHAHKPVDYRFHRYSLKKILKVKFLSNSQVEVK